MVEQRLPNQQRNGVLRSLSPDDLELLQPHLEPTLLPCRKRLQFANQKIKSVYFPESGLTSVVAVSCGEQRKAGVAMLGREGMTGLPVVLGAGHSLCDVFVQVEGAGQCIPADELRAALDQSPTLLKTLLRYAHLFNVQCSYTALANAEGHLKERLARWLLMAQDRIGGHELVLTQESQALMLDVRRSGVTIVLLQFQHRGMIEKAGGCITICDRQGLEECTNGLYGPPEAEFERLFPNWRAVV